MKFNKFGTDSTSRIRTGAQNNNKEQEKGISSIKDKMKLFNRLSNNVNITLNDIIKKLLESKIGLL